MIEQLVRGEKGGEVGEKGWQSVVRILFKGKGKPVEICLFFTILEKWR